MALQITQENGTFLLHGKLNTTTARSFIIHFEYIIAQQQNVVIDIDAISEIDYDGLEAVKTITAIALQQYKLLSIVGNGCKDIYQDLNCSQVA